MGGLVYGYNQGMFGQILSMNSFSKAAGTNGISNATLAGLLTSILELGAWVGVLANGILADRLGRKLAVVLACVVFCIGVAVQAATHGGHYTYILGGRSDSQVPDDPKSLLTTIKVCYWSWCRIALHGRTTLQCRVVSSGNSWFARRSSAACHHLRYNDLVLGRSQ